MNKYLSISFLAVVLVLVLSACTDATVIGGDLIEGNQLPIRYREDIPLELKTLLAENTSLSTGIQNTQEGLAVGCITSPFSGELNSRVGMQIVERSNQLDLTTATVDSIVLTLPMNTLYQIGDTASVTNLRVLGATSASFADAEPLTSTPLLDNGTVYGQISTVPPRTSSPASVFVTTTGRDSSRVDTVGPEVRIVLNQDFRDALLPALAASVANGDEVNDSLFIENFPGIIIEGSDCSATLPAIDLGPSSINRMGVFVYYTDSGFHRQYQLNYRRALSAVGQLRPEYVHNYVGSPAADLLAGANPTDTLAIVQSLSGLMVKVDFTDLSALDNEAVNAAFLEIPIVPGTDDFIRPMPRLLPRVRNDVGDLVNYSAGSPSAPAEYSSAEGGVLIKIPDPRSATSDSIFAYRFNLTTFFQGVITGEVSPPEFFLVARSELLLPGESILVGPGGDANALRARLLLATTELP